MAQAVLLTPKEISNYYKQQELLANPEIKKLSSLDLQMSNILARSDLSSYQKIQLYNDVLQRFQNIRQNILQQNTQKTRPSVSSNDVNETIEEIDETPPANLGDQLGDIQAVLKQMTELLGRKKQPISSSTKKRKRPIVSRIFDTSGSKLVDESTPYNFYKNSINESMEEFLDGPENLENPKQEILKTPTTVKTRQIQNSSAKSKKKEILNPVLTKSAEKLANILKRDRTFNDILEKKEIKGFDFDENLFKNTLNILTSKKQENQINNKSVRELSREIYKFILHNGIQLPQYIKKYPNYKEIANSVSKSPISTRNKRKTKDSNISFESWDTNSKK